jgi:hypothetical protein
MVGVHVSRDGRRKRSNRIRARRQVLLPAELRKANQKSERRTCQHCSKYVFLPGYEQQQPLLHLPAPDDSVFCVFWDMQYSYV